MYVYTRILLCLISIEHNRDSAYTSKLVLQSWV